MNYKLLPKRICFGRHVQSSGNVMTEDDRAASTTINLDFPPTVTGLTQASCTWQYAEDEGISPSYVFTSPFKRCVTTSEKVFPGKYAIEDARLAERWRGIHHTLSKEEIAAQYPLETAISERSGLYFYRPTGGESCLDVEVRLWSFLHSLAAYDLSEGLVAIISHGRLHQIFEKLILGQEVREFELGPVVDEGSLSFYERVDDRPGTLYRVIERNIVPWRGKISADDSVAPA